jgi:hypothetical protein
MPLISIPTSIAGVSVPGITSNGPLGLLYSNPFRSDNLHYPRDLNSLTKGHSVQFKVYEVEPIGYEKLKSYLPSLSTAEQAKNFDLKAFTSGFIGRTAENIQTLVEHESASFETNGLNFQPQREKIVGHISLYMPDTVDFQYNVSYDDSISAVGAIGSVAGAVLDKIVPGSNMGKFGQAVTSAVEAGGTLAKLGLQKAGYAVNPQLQVLFQGIGFREFSMNFTFTPYSKDEAKMVEKIIKMFRKNAAPRIVTAAAGMFFVPPSSFGIEFMFNGKINPHLNKIQNSVITGIDVNYAPQGWSAHDDGAPVQTTLSITFKELTLTDSAQIENGY